MDDILVYGMILFDLIHDEKHIGGPPLNVSIHMARMGRAPLLVSAVGEDELGALARRILEEEGVSDAYVFTDSHKTGRSVTQIDEKGVPFFEIEREAAYEYIRVPEETIGLWSKREFEMLYFGTVEQCGAVTHGTLQKLLSRVRFKKAFYDINLREGLYNRDIVDFSLRHTNILKLNDQEVWLVNGLFHLERQEEAQIVDWLFDTYGIGLILVTRGKDGVSVFGRGEHFDLEGVSVAVKDTVGAGDAFSAGFLSEYMNSGDIRRAAREGNKLGAYVASEAGAVPRRPGNV